MREKAGTQVIDRFWQSLMTNLPGLLDTQAIQPFFVKSGLPNGFIGTELTICGQPLVR
jgi:hypothetical protein